MNKSLRCLFKRIHGIVNTGFFRAPFSTIHSKIHENDGLGALGFQDDPSLDIKLLMNKDLMLQYLQGNIIYQDDYILAVNKPSGLPMSGTMSTLEGGEIALTVSEILPDLGRKFDIPELDLVLPMSKLHSGVLLFSKTAEAKKKLVKCLKTGQVQKQLFQSYMAVCVGKPTGLGRNQEDVYVTREKVHQLLMSFPVKNPSNKSREMGKTIQSVIQADILALNESLQCSLVRLQTNKDKWNCLEVFMTTKLSPVLGDHVYSSRVSSVFGTPLYNDPKTVYPSVQKLSQELLQVLGINSTDRIKIPLHLHREQVVLRNFPHRKAPGLVIQAPLPLFFLKLMDKLHLKLDNLSPAIHKYS